MLTGDGERQRTNVPAIYFCVGLVWILFSLIGVSAFNGSIYRFTRGIDDCGNICGRDNEDTGFQTCGSHDKRDLPFTKVDVSKDPRNPNNTITHSQCVKDCKDYPGYILSFNRCWKVSDNSTSDPGAEFNSIFTNILEDLSVTWPSILLTCGVALIFSYIVLILFRYAIEYVVWIIFSSMVILAAALSIFFLVLFVIGISSKDPQEREAATGAIIAAAVLGIFALILAAILYFFRRRIHLVIQLFKEASKVLIDVPSVIFEPILTFITLTLTCLSYLFFAVIIESSGQLQEIKDDRGAFMKAEYMKTFLQVAAHVSNSIAFIWFTSFTFGCQHFVIASTVCQWFFTRSKDKLDSPLKRAFSHLLNFHIGSVCLGSLLITLVKIIRTIIDVLKEQARKSGGAAAQCIMSCIDCLAQMLEEFIQYLIRNAYIIVALNGTPLIESGKKAFRLITGNLLDVIALNKVGDFVLVVGRIFVMAISGFVCYEVVGKSNNVNYPAIPIIISVIFAFLIIHCFMTVFEMTVDTIFVCFCEDYETNDGMSKPYFMSRGLMEVMYELKGVAGGNFNNRADNPGGEAGQPLTVPIGWKFGNDQY